MNLKPNVLEGSPQTQISGFRVAGIIQVKCDCYGNHIAKKPRLE